MRAREDGPEGGRRWPRRALMAVTMLLALAIVATAVGYLWARDKLDELPRLAISDLQPTVAADPLTRPRTGGGSAPGLEIGTAGPHVLDGADALAFVRSRYYQYYEKGTWRAEGTGDIGRIERQHEFIRALAAKAIHSAHNPFKGARVLDRAVKTVAVDQTFSSSVMLRMAIKLRSLRPADVPSFTLPYQAVNGYGSFGDVLLPVQNEDARVIAAWQQYGAPGASQPTPASTAPPIPRRTTSTAPAPTTTTTVRPPWDPGAC